MGNENRAQTKSGSTQVEPKRRQEARQAPADRMRIGISLNNQRNKYMFIAWRGEGPGTHLPNARGDEHLSILETIVLLKPCYVNFSYPSSTTTCFFAPVRDRKNKTRRKIIFDISKTISWGEKKKVPRDAPRDKNNNFAIIFFKPF